METSHHDTTHYVQVAAIIIMFIIDVVGLLVINNHKKRSSSINSKDNNDQKEAKLSRGTSWSWREKQDAYWLLIGTLLCINLTLDVFYKIDTTCMLPIKAYVFAFPLGLLDLYFSETSGVPMKVILGASLWCSTVILRNYAVNEWYGHEVSPVMIHHFSPLTIFRELIRYVIMLPIVGLLSDMIFSPMHRLSHHRLLYRAHHKEHHEYTNKLTALVLYHGTLLDDFLMPVTTTLGGFLYTLLVSAVLGHGMEGQAFSNVSSYLVVYNTLLSHAHDIRCARLLAPLPDSLNFVAYHYVHHISPSNNFGLTEPSDRFWDAVLGVKTIHKLETRDA